MTVGVILLGAGCANQSAQLTTQATSVPAQEQTQTNPPQDTSVFIAPSSTPQTVKLTKKELIQKHQDLWKKWQEAHQKNLDEIKVARKEAQTKMEELRKKYQQDWQARQKELRDKEEVLKKKWMEENKKIQEEIKNLK
jgi:hypothetical protein